MKSDTPKNRRLQIMPEVLPTPTRTEGPSNARGTTMLHMRRLLATATAAIPLVSCTRSDNTQGTQTVTIPAASTTTSATASNTTRGSLLPPPSATVAPPPTVTPPPDMGYAVVDPMPAPARCMGLANASKASAVFKRDAGGVLIELSLTLPTGAGWTGTKFQTGTVPSPWSGTLLSSSQVGMTSVARVRPSVGAQSLGVQFQIDCPAGPGSVTVSVTFSGPPTETTKPVTQKNDY